MLFDEEFLQKLAIDPIVGILEITRRATVKLDLENTFNGWSEGHYEVLLEAYALLSHLQETGVLSEDIFLPDVIGLKDQDCNAILQMLARVQELYSAEASKLKLQSLKAFYKNRLSGSFVYEFTQGDLERVQALINELRVQVAKSDYLEEDHKRRLLSRLERLQSELHKKMSDLDVFWGWVGDAGVVVGKFGEDVKPIVDRIREITEIVWRTQARAEELPSDSPLPRLEHRPDETEIV